MNTRPWHEYLTEDSQLHATTRGSYKQYSLSSYHLQNTRNTFDIRATKDRSRHASISQFDKSMHFSFEKIRDARKTRQRGVRAGSGRCAAPTSRESRGLYKTDGVPPTYITRWLAAAHSSRSSLATRAPIVLSLTRVCAFYAHTRTPWPSPARWTVSPASRCWVASALAGYSTLPIRF